jgi:hypothetical protein
MCIKVQSGGKLNPCDVRGDDEERKNNTDYNDDL